jgi:[acyl-carrier-protein] S-malonyltransferase
MGKALADAFPQARDVFSEVDEALGEKLSATIWEGPAETLTLTENAQPALMAVSIAALRAFEASGAALSAKAAYVAGHSLGEYSALAAAGTFKLADAARLLRIRGRAMQAAVPVGTGAMAALIGLDYAAAKQVADDAGDGQVCEIANDNGGGQIVISGHATAIERAVGLAKERGARRAVLLPVSAPFHCSLMAPAAEAMDAALREVAMAAPAVPLVANVLARPVSDPDEIRQRLVEQVTSPVRWQESITWLAEAGVDLFVEIGAGKVLTGLARRIADNVEAINIGNPEDMDAAAARLA